MNNPNENTELSVAEGVLLGHALVARVAAELGVRAFFIKGPVSVLQGLRKPKTSGDVDVFVSPQDLDAVVGALQEKGWRKRPVDPDSKTFPKHSVTVDHPEWPCCIDVHFRFPGMEAPAADCFETMWANTEQFALAGQDIRVPSKPLAILILALHALRSSQLPARRDELNLLSGFVSQRSMALPVLDLSVRTGSLAAMRPLLQDVVPNSEGLVWPEPSAEWRNRLLVQELGSARIMALVQARWQDKPLLLWRAVFPPRAAFLAGNIYSDMSLKGLLVQHAARWSRFLRALPKIARDLKRYRG
ncbi:nucleotidyltransferase family protein [Pseudarthrobacter chlorophenolicus]|uniref:nucleotidyltransferase family protein n=1 Tax=Pseudarthrobacter chlorophenolicus TaxID=85085 RepID=UPI0005F2DFDF|nr:nucleotidyltransferase family protein [Pseudarthrobacter chlorophenolicus]